MSWLATLAIGVLTALATMVAAGYVANLAVGWYRITSFEGASGYWVIGMALVGFIAGLLVGVIVARTLGPGFGRALGLSLAVSLGGVAAIGAVARLRADVAPASGGEEFTLLVEFRWPAGTPLPSVGTSVEWFLRLSSLSGRTVRASRTGPLWREDAREEDGRWIVPGAVDVFMARGERLIDAVPDGVIANGFLVPLPRRPGAEHQAWSGWLPELAAGQSGPADGVSFRFRVVPRSEPIRTEHFGPFEVATISRGLGEVTFGNHPPMWSADADFLVRHAGEPLELQAPNGDAQSRITAVAAVEAALPALVVRGEDSARVGHCHLVVSESTGVRVEPLGGCDGTLLRAPLTNDARVYAEALARRVPDGRFDRASFTGSRFYLVGESILDAERLSVRPVVSVRTSEVIERIPPLGISPDGLSLVRLGFGEGGAEEWRLVVIRIDTGEAALLPIDRSRMRLGEIDQVDPAWVLHHFEWRRDADGTDHLVERAGFDPLPYRGRLSEEHGYREYRVGPALAGLRPALIAFLVEAFDAMLVPAGATDFAHEVVIRGDTVHVSYRPEDAHVGVWMNRGTDSRLVAEIAARFDAALATFRFDEHFGVP